jgi:DNA-binding SARP family transcriptional activator
MKVQLLGQARVVLEQQSHPLGLDKRGALLAYLAYANEWVLRDQLAFLFWPDSEDAKAKINLRQLLKRTKELTASRSRFTVNACAGS